MRVCVCACVGGGCTFHRLGRFFSKYLRLKERQKLGRFLFFRSIPIVLHGVKGENLKFGTVIGIVIANLVSPILSGSGAILSVS